MDRTGIGLLLVCLLCVSPCVLGQTMGCVAGWYGDQCNDVCQSSNCQNNQCDQTTGLCTDCAPGFYNLPWCSTTCRSSNCQNNQCDKTSGLCLSCPTNFDGHLCQDCVPGKYGDQCSFTCQSNRCLDGRCNKRTGWCDYCPPGFALYGCSDCVPGKYGDQCSFTCQSNRCLDGRCNKGTGWCDTCPPGFAGNDCSDCVDGRYGDICNNNCRPGCTRCDQDSGDCTACVANSNLKFPGCTECLEGYYKENSRSTRCTECTWRCLDNTVCSNTTGDCADCPPGKTGNRCDQACSPGRYGSSRCAETCGQCKGGRCDAVTGHCAQCQPGWQAPLCKTPCAPHMYGENCSERCGHCKGEQPCNASTGECTGECQPGYTGTLCKTECGAGLYGAECNQTCGHCQVNTTCHHEDGHCLVGCVAEFAGPLCLQGCRPGYHGQQCDESCSTIADQCVQCTQSGQCTACSGHFQLPQCTGSDQSRLAVVSGILGAGLMVTIAVLVFLCWRFRSQLIVQKQDTLASVYADPITAGSNAYTEPPSVALSPPDEACGNTQHEIRDPGNPYEQLRVYSNMMFDREAHSDPEPRGTDVTTPKSTSEYVNVTLEHIYANMSSGPKTKKKPRKKKAK